MLGKHVVNDDVVDDDDDIDDDDHLSVERVRPDAGERQLEEIRWTVGAEGGERLVLDSKVLRKVLQFMMGIRMIKRFVVFGEKEEEEGKELMMTIIMMIRMMMRMRMIRKPEFSAMCLDRHPLELSSRRE